MNLKHSSCDLIPSNTLELDMVENLNSFTIPSQSHLTSTNSNNSTNCTKAIQLNNQIISKLKSKLSLIENALEFNSFLIQFVVEFLGDSLGNPIQYEIPMLHSESKTYGSLKWSLSDIVFGSCHWTFKHIKSLEKSMARQIKLNQHCEEWMHKSDDVIIAQTDSNYSWDWESISREVNGKSSWECQIYFNNIASPFIDKSEWNDQDLDQLESIIQEHGDRNWERIASLFNQKQDKKRTIWQLFQLYKDKLQKNTLKNVWTQEQDSILKEKMKLFVDCKPKWTLIAQDIPPHTRTQCFNRWQSLQSSTKRKGKWNQEEDEALLEGIGLYGRGKWKLISTLIPTRTQTQIRERYENVLNPCIKSIWTDEESKQLLEYVDQLGKKWSIISKKIPGNHTDYQVCFFYNFNSYHLIYSVENNG